MAPRKKGTEAAVSTAVTIPGISIQRLELRVVGDSPLICHAWSAKARKQMLDRQMKRAKAAKEAKDPAQDFRDSLYVLSGSADDLDAAVFGFPAIGFKSALTDAASFVDGLTKVQLRGALHFANEYVVIEGRPTMRQDMVKVGMGTADIRYRGEFREWAATLNLTFNASNLTPEQIAHLATLAGFSIGVGEWRPQRDGSFGRFHVE